MPSSNFSDNGFIDIPANAKDISIDCAAARGGSGGMDAGASRAQGGGGRRATIYLPNYIARRLTFYIGKQPQFINPQPNRYGAYGGNGLSVGGRGGDSGPQGYSGGGGGGGGSTGIYDDYKSGYIAVFGGGGGGGGASLRRSGQPGQPGLGMNTGNPDSASQGAWGSSCPNDGGGGGGGGAGCPGQGGGAFGIDDAYGGSRGSGGSSGYDSLYCSFTSNSGYQNYGDGFANVTYTLVNPQIDTFTNNGPIIKGNAATLTWTTTNATSASIDQSVGVVLVDGSTDVSPTTTTTYTLSATFGGVTVTDTTEVVVYIPPVLTITTDKSAIIAGQTIRLDWSHTGDGTTVFWTSGNPPITNGNTNSFTNPRITLYDSTTYCAYITGLGGTSPTVCVSITVYQIPTISTFEVPVSIFYGDTSLSIAYKSEYANTIHELKIYASRSTGPDAGSILVDTIDLPLAGSAELGASNTVSEGTYSWTPSWDDHGPRSYSITYKAEGQGGSITSGPLTTSVIIDETPDNLDIPASDGLIKDAAPVISPDVEIMTDESEITDIDIPVEIKSNYPIAVEVNDSTIWENVREL